MKKIIIALFFGLFIASGSLTAQDVSADTKTQKEIQKTDREAQKAKKKAEKADKKAKKEREEAEKRARKAQLEAERRADELKSKSSDELEGDREDGDNKNQDY